MLVGLGLVAGEPEVRRRRWASCNQCGGGGLHKILSTFLSNIFPGGGYAGGGGFGGGAGGGGGGGGGGSCPAPSMTQCRGQYL